MHTHTEALFLSLSLLLSLAHTYRKQILINLIINANIIEGETSKFKAAQLCGLSLKGALFVHLHVCVGSVVDLDANFKRLLVFPSFLVVFLSPF